jgi:hypothetical protein
MYYMNCRRADEGRVGAGAGSGGKSMDN